MIVVQGDPRRSYVFNALLEQLFRALKSNWLSKGFGIRLEFVRDVFLTNLRYADEVLLFASNLRHLTCLLQRPYGH